MTSSENERKRVTPSALLGRGMRRVREGEGKVLHDVASAARELGFKWDPSLVSRIETGKRDLSLDEFWMLPHVMSLALNRPVLLSELLPGPQDDTPWLAMPDEQYHLVDNFLHLSAEALATSAGWEKTTETLPTLLRKQSADALSSAMKSAQARREPADSDSPWERLSELSQEFGVPPAVVFDAMTKLWDMHTLDLERERRLVASGEDLSNPTRVRTIRGHLTRQLTGELREYLEANPPKPVKTKKG